MFPKSKSNVQSGRATLLLVLLLTVFSFTDTSAQIKGLIVQPSTSAGQAVLDPNKDGYVSAGKTGFSANDIAESEISYKGLPQLSQDPNSDLGPGPDCGFTDLVDLGSGEHAISMNVDANNNLLFRFRLGSSSPNSKGYSILIDIDNKFGNTGSNADPNYTSVNPGFEIEVVLRTNFGVDLNDVDGRSTPLTKTTLSYNDYAQKSIAYTTNCGDYDYFYDFYMPVSTITTYFSGFSTSTTLRVVGNTVIAPKSALEGPISDLGGVDDRIYLDNAAAAWSALVNNFVPTSLSGIQSGSSFSPDRSDAPVISTPIASTAVSISGTSTEAAGTSIVVYKNGVSMGTTTVGAAGAWTLSSITVTAGDVITATAQATNESVSLASTSVTVGGTSCSAPPTLNCGSDKGIIINGPTGAATGTIINVYRVTTSGPVLISSGPTISGNTYTYKCNNSFQNCNSGQRCVIDGTYYFTATESGKCESVPSAFWNNGCTASATAPAITVRSTTALSGTTNVAGQTIIINLDDVFYGTATASSTLTNGSYAWSFSGFSATAGQVVSVRGISSGGCATAASTATITEVAAAPVITTTSISTATTTVSGTSTEANGSIITIYTNGVAIGTATVNYGLWTLNAPVSGFGLSSGDVITAKVTTATNKTTSDASNSVTVATATTRIPTITSPVNEAATSVSGTSTSPVGTVIKLYLDGDLIGQTTVVSGGTWSVTSIDPNYKLYPGGKLTATATETGIAESAHSTAVVIDCTIPVATKTVSATNTCQTYTADVTISNPEASVLYRLKSGSTYYSAYAVALAGANTLIITSDALPNVTTLTLSVEAMKIAPSTCSTNLNNTVTVNVYGLPNNSLTVTPATSTVCSGTPVNISIANSEIGVNYQLRSGTTNIGTAVAGTGNTIILPVTLTSSATLNILATNGTTGCNRTLTTTPVITVNAQQKSIAALSSTVCSGGNTDIQVLDSENGTLYRLTNGSSTVISSATSSSNGSTITLNTGSISSTTTFYVTAIKAGCTTQLASTATVSVGNPLSLTVAASATTICSGSSVNLTITNSQAGVNYQLQFGGVNVGSAIPGTGSSITPLALATISPTATTNTATANTYSVVATRTTGTCASTILSVPQITVNVQPTSRTVTFPTDIVCSGSSANISVASSQTGVNYQLRSGTTNIGSPVAGNGGTINLSTGALTTSTAFNILATSASGNCSLVLATTGTVLVNGQKTISAISNTLCSGQSTDITVANTVSGVNYTLWNGATSIVTIPGDGGTIGLPTGNLSATTTFTVRAVHGSGGNTCTITMTTTPTVTVTNPSGTLTLSAPTAVCSGSSANVTVANSENGVSYQLKIVGGANVGTPVNGNNGTINLPTGAITASTQYEVVATRSLGGCVTTLNTKPAIAVNMQPASKTVTGPASSICNNSSTTITVSNVEAGVTYVLRNGTTVVDSKTGTAGSTVSLATGNLTSNTTFNVIAATSTCTTALSNVTVNVVAQQKNVFAEVSTVCAGGSTNILVELSGATVTYQLRNGSTNIGSPVAGNGGTISLPTGAITSTTTFTVISYTSSPVCTTTMSITPTVTVTTPTSNNTVTAPEGVCSGASATITVANSQTGVTYYLRNGATVLSSNAGSNGSSVNLTSGSIVTGTTFNILAVHVGSGCSTVLAATPFVEIDCEAVYTPGSATYASGYNFAPNESIATVSDADGFNNANINTAVITSGSLPAGISLNPFTGQIYVSNAWWVTASAVTVGIRTTDVNGKTTNHLFSITIATPGVPLPVEFISFTGKLVNNKVELAWATAWETNNDYFTIERSSDGIVFQAIGTRKGAGNSTQVINYSFTDATPLNGISYYRIKQTDFNGDFDYSKTVAIRNYRTEENAIAVNVYPNPVVNAIVNISIPQAKGETVYLQVSDALGRVQIEQNITMEDNATTLNLVSKDGQRIKPGVYNIVAYVKNERFTVKIIIN